MGQHFSFHPQASQFLLGQVQSPPRREMSPGSPARNFPHSPNPPTPPSLPSVPPPPPQKPLALRGAQKGFLPKQGRPWHTLSRGPAGRALPALGSKSHTDHGTWRLQGEASYLCGRIQYFQHQCGDERGPSLGPPAPWPFLPGGHMPSGCGDPAGTLRGTAGRSRCDWSCAKRFPGCLVVTPP